MIVVVEYNYFKTCTVSAVSATMCITNWFQQNPTIRLLARRNGHPATQSSSNSCLHGRIYLNKERKPTKATEISLYYSIYLVDTRQFIIDKTILYFSKL